MLIDRQKSEGKTDVVVPLLTTKPSLLFYNDIRPTPDAFWQNKSVAEYFEVNSIIALPVALLSDENKIAAFKAGDIDVFAAAGPNTPDFQFLLAELYDPRFPGLGETTKDFSEAFRWYKKSAEGGFSAAQRRLSGFYARGLVVPKNYLYALGWLLRSMF